MPFENSNVAILNKTLILEKSLNVLTKWQSFQWKENIQYLVIPVDL